MTRWPSPLGMVLFLVLASLAVAHTPIYYDDFTWQEIESVVNLTPWLLETGSIIKVKNDSSVIMPQQLLDWATASSEGNPSPKLPFFHNPQVYIQSDFSKAEMHQLPKTWTPIGLCIDNTHSETPTTVVKAATLFDSTARALKIHLSLLETNLKFKTAFFHTEATTQKAFCEVDPGKVLQIQGKVNRVLAQNVCQRTIRILPALKRDGYRLAFGNWSNVPDRKAVYEVGYTLGCITDERLLECGDEEEEWE